MKYSINKLFKSFGFAIKGIIIFFRSQQNARVQLLVSIVVLTMSWLLQLDFMEWCIVILCIGAVLGAEAFNTAIEHLCDTLHPGHSEGIGKVKDISAGAVLLISVIAVITGLIIFVPRLTNLF